VFFQFFSKNDRKKRVKGFKITYSTTRNIIYCEKANWKRKMVWFLIKSALLMLKRKVPHQRVIPTHQLKSVLPDGGDDVMDLTCNEIECLKRYHTMFRVLIESGQYQPLTRELTEDDVGKNLQSTILDWSVNQALQGKEAIEEMNMNLSYTVLQAALILTITIPLYINVPEFSSDNITRAFSAVVGFSAFSHVLVLIGCTIQTFIFSRPYSDADTYMQRIECNGLIIFIVAMNYIALFSGLVATLLAGFGRAFVDGVVQLYMIGFLGYVIAVFVNAVQRTGHNQDIRILRFYKKYCDIDGQLKDEYIEMLKRDMGVANTDKNDEKK
jgi:hypothetical protein